MPGSRTIRRGSDVVIGAEGAATGIRTPKWTDAEYAALQDGFTLDATFRLDAIAGGYVDVFGGMQSGGIGLEAVGTSATTYELQFWYASPRPAVSLKYGQWYHVTAWYDGQDARLYVDGVRKAESEGVSFSVKPSAARRSRAVIGGRREHVGRARRRHHGRTDRRSRGLQRSALRQGRVPVATRELTALDTMPPLVRVAPEPRG